MISHIFFDLHGTLIHPPQMSARYDIELGRIMAARFGQKAEVWTEARRRIDKDWDSYFADLDLTGDRGIDDMWEGLYRTTRALFRLVNVPEPDRDTLWSLVRELPELATQSCDAVYPDAREVVQKLHAAGKVLGITSHAIVPQIRGTLTGGGLMDYFAGPLVGPDTAGQFDKDARFYDFAARAAGVKADVCLVVDDAPDALAGASAAGMGAAQICRPGRLKPVFPDADCLLNGSLSHLLDRLIF
jgi:FMN phosphatase YigB (HAD superfamily)